MRSRHISHHWSGGPQQWRPGGCLFVWAAQRSGWAETLIFHMFGHPAGGQLDDIAEQGLLDMGWQSSNRGPDYTCCLPDTLYHM